jgi:hypothetical protein
MKFSERPIEGVKRTGNSNAIDPWESISEEMSLLLKRSLSK